MGVSINVPASMSNYSYLIESMGSSASAGWMKDYASIKNGSYGKLMKAYYSEMTTDVAGVGAAAKTADAASKRSSKNILEKLEAEKKNPKVSKEAQKSNTALESGLSALKSSVSTLRDEATFQSAADGVSAADKMVSAVKAYVKDYNSVVTAAKGSTLTNKTAYVSNMMNSTSANAGKLSEIGVTIGSNGTLSLDETKLKAASLVKVQDLFSSSDVMSYGSTLASRLQLAGNTTAASAGKDVSNSAGDSTAQSAAAASLKADAKTLASDALYEKVKDKDGKETDQYNADKILSAVKSFAANYNSTLDAASSSTNSGVASNVSYMKSKTADNKNALSQFGISVDAKGKMSVDAEAFKKSDMGLAKQFFKDYGSSIATNASLVDYYMKTQASAANSYNANGAYNVQGNALYTGMV